MIVMQEKPTHFNLEIKARCENPEQAELWLQANGAVFHGLDHQTDIYFHVPSGRLKLRRGNVENSLIYYERLENKGPKRSDVYLERLPAGNGMEQVLKAALGERFRVEKKRKIYFIDHVKFHIDEVKGLGQFVEIEVISNPDDDPEQARKTCLYYMEKLGIKESDIVSASYSDLV